MFSHSIDNNLLYSLLKAITPGTKLIFVGDTDQLPSVGAGNVLKDIIGSGCFPVTRLARNNFVVNIFQNF